MRDVSEIVRDTLERQARDTERLMNLVDEATDLGVLRDELGENGFDAFWYDDDPVKAVERRCLWAQTAALGAIALLLLRRDEGMWGAWNRY